MKTTSNNDYNIKVLFLIILKKINIHIYITLKKTSFRKQTNQRFH